MANHDLILGQSHDLALGHDQQLVLNHNHNLGLNQNHDLELGQTDEHHLDLGQPLDHDELGLGHAHDHELDLGQNQDNEGHDDVHTYGHENELAMDQKPEDGYHELPLPEHNHELALTENNDLTVSENQEFDDSMALTVHNHEMGIDSGDDIGVHSELIPSMIQARALPISYNYEFSEGQEFPDAQSCHMALRDNAIALPFEMQTIKYDKTRFTTKFEGMKMQSKLIKFFSTHLNHSGHLRERTSLANSLRRSYNGSR